jgi:gliding motility-associated-like protein
MRTCCLLLIVFLSFFSKLNAQTAQYATTGSGKMRNYISWFDWSGITIANNTNTTFTTADGLSIKISFSNVSGPSLRPYVMNTWSGAVLWKLYDFINPSVKPALFSEATIDQVSFTMNITATRNGVATPFTLVAVDAEASDNNETTLFNTSGTAWRTIEFYKNSSQTANPLSGCGTKTVNLSQTYGNAAQTGQNPILATDAAGSLTISTTMNRTVIGGMAVAFGIFSPIDRGDLPGSYSNAQHGLRFTTANSCNYNAPFPSIIQEESLTLGSVIGDADGEQSLDDNASGLDEDAVSSFPTYDGSGTYSIDVKLKNVTGSNAYLSGWFDYNRNGSFSNSEAVNVTIPNGGTVAKLTWTGLPSNLPGSSISEFGFRLRLASSQTDVSSPSNYANNGEVEDYLISSHIIISNVIASFTAPDTVCVNTPVNITNTSIGTTTNFWNFCVANSNTTPIGNNMGNIGGAFSLPVYIDYVYEGGNYYGFQTNNFPGKLLRLEFGNSLLNTPKVIDLGTVGGAVPDLTEGLQIVKNEGKWYVIVVGGNSISALPAIGKIELGTNIANNAPIGTYWGNIGNLDYPHDLYMFNDNGRWYGFTVNTNNNTLTRFDFTSSFDNKPTGTNLGNIGNLDGPTGVYAIKDNGNWHVFVTNAYSHTLTRLDFGSSLLSTPTGHNLGNINNKFHRIWDIQLLKSCGETIGYAINAETAELLKLDFKNSITNIPTVESYGNIGNLSFPHCLSKIFRVGSDLYTFVPNVNNNSLSRIRFPGCTTSSIASSNLFNPPAIIYNTPGTYSINLTIDDGLPTQTSICKQVVVLPAPVHLPPKSITICTGDSIKVGASAKFSTYVWNTGAIKDSMYISSAGTYWVEANQKGCINRDSFSLALSAVPEFKLRTDTSICKGESIKLTTSPTGTYTFNWTPAAGLSSTSAEAPVAAPQINTQYIVAVSNNNNCVKKDTVVISIKPQPIVALGRDTAICAGDSLLLDAQNPGAKYQWQDGSSLQSLHAKSAGSYFVKVEKDGCSASDTILLSIKAKPSILTLKDSSVCEGIPITLNTQSGGSYSYSWFPSSGLSSTIISSPVATPVANTSYVLTATSNDGCIAKDTTHVEVFRKPLITLTNDTSICINSSLPLMASGGISYKWFPEAGLSSAFVANPIATPLSTTKYYVTVTSNQNCINTDSVWVSIKQPAVFSKPEDKEICKGEAIQLVSDNKFDHSWSPATYLSSATSSSPLASPPVSTVYTVVISDPVCKESSTFNVEVKVKPAPIIRVEKSNDIDCTKQSAQLTASGADTYTWEPAQWLNDPTKANPVSVAQSNITYKVEGTSMNGCSSIDSITVDVKYNGELGVFIPSAFTPNGDGKNDCFGIKNWQAEGKVELSIFNRWGELMFSTNDPSKCWDGRYKGSLLQSGVFIYIIKGNTSCGEIKKQGTFTLIR